MRGVREREDLRHTLKTKKRDPKISLVFLKKFSGLKETLLWYLELPERRQGSVMPFFCH
jgi:hypothetical protein